MIEKKIKKSYLRTVLFWGHVNRKTYTFYFDLMRLAFLKVPFFLDGAQFDTTLILR